MMKNYKTRDMKPAKPTALVCIRECEAPGIGAWKVGDIVEDERALEYLKDNPNFKPKEA